MNQLLTILTSHTERAAVKKADVVNCAWYAWAVGQDWNGFIAKKSCWLEWGVVHESRNHYQAVTWDKTNQNTESIHPGLLLRRSLKIWEVKTKFNTRSSIKKWITSPLPSIFCLFVACWEKGDSKNKNKKQLQFTPDGSYIFFLH